MRNILFTLLAICFLSCNNAGNNAATGAGATTAEPVAKSVRANDCEISAEVAAKIQDALSLQELEDMSDDEARDWKPCNAPPCNGLTDQTFDTTYDDHCILSIKREAEYMGAYPSTGITYHNFDKRTGEKIKAADVFIVSKMDGLVAECNRRIADIITDGRKKIDEADTAAYDDEVEHRAPFTSETLEKFSIEDDGIVFNYDFEFPHVIQALQPDGDINFSLQQIKPYLNPNGQLGFLLNSPL